MVDVRRSQDEPEPDLETIADAWDGFRPKLLSKSTPPDLVALVREGFYCGALSALALLQDATDSRDVRHVHNALQTWKGEVRDFLRNRWPDHPEVWNLIEVLPKVPEE